MYDSNPCYIGYSPSLYSVCYPVVCLSDEDLEIIKSKQGRKRKAKREEEEEKEEEEEDEESTDDDDIDTQATTQPLRREMAAAAARPAKSLGAKKQKHKEKGK